MNLHPSSVSSSYVLKVMACERNKFNDRVKLHPSSVSSSLVIKVKTWERNKFNDRYSLRATTVASRQIAQEQLGWTFAEHRIFKFVGGKLETESIHSCDTKFNPIFDCKSKK